MSEFCKDLDRKVAVVNLDPANEQMLYKASIDIVSRIKYMKLPKVVKLLGEDFVAEKLKLNQIFHLLPI